jgi:predicted phosphodiesterase
MSDIHDAIAEEAGLDPDLLRLAEAAAAVHAKGIDVRLEHGEIVTETHPVDRDRTVSLDIGKDHIRLGVVADTHGGSHYEQLSALRTFYRYADDEGVDAFVHVGDWTQGSDKMHLDQPYQVHTHGADQQVDYVARTYPRSSRPGVLTYGISGNHDDSFLKDGGVNVLRRIAEHRDDIAYVGQTAAYLTFGRLNLYAVHPRKGAAYAKSYHLQKFAEALPIGRLIHLLLMGHVHS